MEALRGCGRRRPRGACLFGENCDKTGEALWLLQRLVHSLDTRTNKPLQGAGRGAHQSVGALRGEGRVEERPRVDGEQLEGIVLVHVVIHHVVVEEAAVGHELGLEACESSHHGSRFTDVVVVVLDLSFFLNACPGRHHQCTTYPCT